MQVPYLVFALWATRCLLPWTQLDTCMSGTKAQDTPVSYQFMLRNVSNIICLPLTTKKAVPKSLHAHFSTCSQRVYHLPPCNSRSPVCIIFGKEMWFLLGQITLENQSVKCYTVEYCSLYSFWRQYFVQYIFSSLSPSWLLYSAHCESEPVNYCRQI